MKEVDEKERLETQEKMNLGEGVKIKLAKGMV